MRLDLDKLKLTTRTLYIQNNRSGMMVEKSKEKYDIKTLLIRKRAEMEEKRVINYRLVKARKLRIKMHQLFSAVENICNTTLTESNSLQNCLQHSEVVQKGRYVQLNKSKVRPIAFHSLASIKQKKVIRSIKSIDKDKAEWHQSRSFSYKSNRDLNMNIGLFVILTDWQLQEIESNEMYYLGRQEYIELYREYMMRKRRRENDWAQERLLKGQLSERQGTQFQNPEKDHFIPPLLFIKHHVEERSAILNTPPTTVIMTRVSFKENNHKLEKIYTKYTNFQQKISENKRKISSSLQHKILNMRIQIYKNINRASINKADLFDLNLAKLTMKNKINAIKIINIKDKLKEQSHNYSKAVQIATTLREQIIKVRSHVKLRSITK